MGAAQVFWRAVLTAKSILEEVGVNPLKITFRYLCQKVSESSADLALRHGWDCDERCISCLKNAPMFISFLIHKLLKMEKLGCF